jgi:hypothetical protein
MQDMVAIAGFGLVFKRFGYYECCQLEPKPVDYSTCAGRERARSAMLYRGSVARWRSWIQITAVDLTNVPTAAIRALTWLTDGFPVIRFACAKLKPATNARPWCSGWKIVAAYIALFPPGEIED